MRTVLLYLLISYSVLAEELPLTVLVTHFPPFIDQEAPSEGLSWNLLNDFAKNKGIFIQAKYLPTARLLRQIEIGDWQATITPVPSKTSGLVKVNYAKNMVSYGLLVEHSTPLELKGLHIAAIRAGGHSVLQDYLSEQGVIISEVNNLDQGYLMYKAGRVDAVLGVMMDGKVMGVSNNDNFVMSHKLAEFSFTLSLNADNPVSYAAYQKLTSP